MVDFSGSQKTEPLKSSVSLNDIQKGGYMKFTEMDDKVTLFAQMEAEGSPVILINKFNVAPSEVEQFLQVWAEDAAFMKRQPGFIFTQLYRGIAGSCVFINYAVWESVADFKRAINQPEFQSHLKNYPPSTAASPHLLTKVAVPGICVA
jgi:heme-degrading monooxygenase HmoA